MKIVRERRSENFTVLANTSLRDRRLSFRSRGLLGFLLSQPDGYRTNSDTLAFEAPEGRDAIRTALRELEAAGYLSRRKDQDPATGRWSTVMALVDSPVPATATVSESPTPENPSSAARRLENRTSENQALREKNYTQEREQQTTPPAVVDVREAEHDDAGAAAPPEAGGKSSKKREPGARQRARDLAASLPIEMVDAMVALAGEMARDPLQFVAYVRTERTSHISEAGQPLKCGGGWRDVDMLRALAKALDEDYPVEAIPVAMLAAAVHPGTRLPGRLTWAGAPWWVDADKVLSFAEGTRRQTQRDRAIAAAEDAEQAAIDAAQDAYDALPAETREEIEHHAEQQLHVGETGGVLRELVIRTKALKLAAHRGLIPSPQALTTALQTAQEVTA